MVGAQAGLSSAAVIIPETGAFACLSRSLACRSTPAPTCISPGQFRSSSWKPGHGILPDRPHRLISATRRTVRETGDKVVASHRCAETRSTSKSLDKPVVGQNGYE